MDIIFKEEDWFYWIGVFGRKIILIIMLCLVDKIIIKVLDVKIVDFIKKVGYFVYEKVFCK